MATGASTTYTTVQPAPVACIYSEARYGSNGAVGGDPELLLGHDGSDAVTGRITWDAASGNFDTGICSVVTVVPAAGGSSHMACFNVSSSTPYPLHYGNKSYGSMASVTITAGVQIGAAVTVTNLSVKFYKVNILADSYSSAVGPAVDTRGGAGSPVAEQILVITPKATDYTWVSIAFTLEMQAPSGTYPDTDDLFAQTFIATSTCT